MVNQLTSGPLAVYWGNSVMVRLVKSKADNVALNLLFSQACYWQVLSVHWKLNVLGSVHCPSATGCVHYDL